MKNDMTRGSILKSILYFTTFIFLGNLFQQFYNIIDSLIVGNVNGEDALASISATGPICFMFIGLLIGVSSGFGIKMAHVFGAKKFDLLRKYHAMAIFLSFVLGSAITFLLLVFNNLILKFMNTPDNIYIPTYIYIMIIYVGIVPTMFYNLCSSTLRAVGNGKMPLVFLIISSVTNIILDIVFVYYFSFGVIGAAIATVISQVFSVFISFIYIFKKYSFLKVSKRDFKIDKKIIFELLKQGVPMGLQFSITAFGVMVVQVELNKYGAEYIAGFGVSSKIQGIVMQLFIGLGIAISNFIGQNYGAKKFDRIKRGISYSTVISIIFSIIAIFLIKTFGNVIVESFVPNASYIMKKSASIYFNCVMYFYPCLALLFVYRNALQGFGRSDLSMLGGVFELIARVLVIVLLTSSYGYYGVCFSDSLAWVFALIPLIPLFFVVYNKEINKNKQKIEMNL
ncbi:hypothetical protein HMPREF3188_01530 [Tissierellia bacterium KA00581]|jgi:hypothetical protein|nr:hypothetical protein HMPREF3188_01530 [Tissierellia bacterium KA00581]